MHPIGYSTGAIALGDFKLALAQMHEKPFTAVELSALRISELPTLIKAIPALDLQQFEYTALHAPSTFTPEQEREIVYLLLQVPNTFNLVLHPDTIHDPSNWTAFGNRLLLENMDRRKSTGRTVDELSRWFDALPSARFCLDLAHAQQVDTTMTEAYLLIKAFGDRLCQVHISQLDSASHHYSLSMSSIRAFSEVAWLLPDKIPFIIESRVVAEEMEEEAEKVVQVVSSTPKGAYLSIPA